MKHVMHSLMAAVLLVSMTLAGCSNSTEEESSTDTETVTASETAEETAVEEQQAENLQWVKTKKHTEKREKGTGAFIRNEDTVWTYDDAGNMIERQEYIQDEEDGPSELKKDEVYTYDDNGNLIQYDCVLASDLDEGRHDEYTYDESGRMLSDHTYYDDDPDKETTLEFTYEDGDEYTLSVTYDASHNEISRTERTFDENGNLTHVETNEDGETEVKDYTYDEQGRRASYSTSESEYGSSYSAEYYYSPDGEQHTLRYQSSISGKTTEFTYNEEGQEVGYTVYSSRGDIVNTGEIRYDENGNNVLDIINNEGEDSFIVYEYDDHGNLTKKTDYSGAYDDSAVSDESRITHWVSYVYDDNGNLITKTYPNDDGTETVTNSKYDENNNLIYTERWNMADDYTYDLEWAAVPVPVSRYVEDIRPVDTDEADFSGGSIETFTFIE